MPTVTLKVTYTQEKLELIFHFLEENQVHFQKEGDEFTERLSQKERLLKRYRERSHLKGMSQDRQKLRQEFREDFEL